jgi:hypothetical protein
VERVVDPASVPLKDFWEEEWQRNLINAAMERVKKRIQADHYQIFYLASVKRVASEKIAKLHGISRAQVYLVKHRIERLIKNEVRKLEAEHKKGGTSGAAPVKGPSAFSSCQEKRPLP